MRSAPADLAACPAPRPVPRGRLALLLGGGVAMLLGLDAGLLLLGLPAPVTTERLPEVHGQLMLIGFLGTVIALERAVALRRPWGFTAPLATGLGSLLLLTALPVAVGQGVQLIGLHGAGRDLRCPCGDEPRPRRSRSSGWVLSWPRVGCCCGPRASPPVPCSPGWPGSSYSRSPASASSWPMWQPPGPGAQVGLVAVAAAVAIGAAAALLWPTPGTEVFGLTLLALVGWLLRHDVATRTVRSVGLPRYSAVNLLLGMAWLAVAGGPGWCSARRSTAPATTWSSTR